jgi:acyl-CoA synthetase (NDP forming)/RimJ/RimL family protein N-acetyltransferase
MDRRAVIPGVPSGAADPDRWCADVVLADGGTVHLRPVRPDDAARIEEFHSRQSPDSIYMRYFTAMPVLTPRMIDNLIQVDFLDHAGFLVELGDQVVAMASFDRWPDSDVAEVSFMVDEDHRGRGLATVLLEYLVVAAREAGLSSLTAMTLPTNIGMLAVFRRAGFEEGRTFADGLIEVRLGIKPTEEAIELIEQRSAMAAARSVARLLAPRSVAVVGAGREPGGLGHELFANLLDGRFEGAVYPVNPRGGHVRGVRAWPSVVDVPDDLDLAILAVPAANVPAVVLECARKRVRSLVVVTAGFDRTGEMGAPDDGELLSAGELVALARRWGMRLLGPESLGLVNTDPSVSMVATFAPVSVRPGAVGFLTQSGTLGLAALDLAARRGVGISAFVDVGAKADVSGNDVLEYWEHDERTKVALLYLESFGNPRKFVRIARRMGRTTPLVAVKAGDLRPPGREGEPSESAWPESATYGALLAQCGVVRVDNLRELFDVARVLLHQPVPRGPRLAVVSNSRGATAMTVDACAAAGLCLAPGADGVAAPVDLAFDAGPEEYAAAVRAAVAAGTADAVVIIYAPANRDRRDEVAAAVGAATDPTVPTLATFLRAGTDEPFASGPVRIPLFEFPGDAVRVLGLLAGYGEWLERDPGEVPVGLSAAAVATVRDLVDRVLTATPEGRWLDWDEVSQLAAITGLPLAPGELVEDATAAVAAAERLGAPVVLKALGVAAHYRAEQGGVALGLRSPDEVAAAHGRMVAAVGDAMRPALVQHMAGAGVDVLVAGHQHPNVGAVVQVGLGGIAAAADGGRPVALVPLTDRDARRQVTASSVASTLAAADPTGAATAHLERVLLGFSGLLDAVPEVADLVANPVIVGPAGAVLTDLAVRLSPSALDKRPDVRRL